MSFTQTPLTPSEIPSYTKIHYGAFAASAHSVSPIFYPRGLTPSITAYLHTLQTANLQDPATHIFLLRDSATSSVIGIAKWIFYLTSKTSDDLLTEEASARADRVNQAPVDGINFGAIGAFRDVQASAHRVHMRGQPHVYLSILATATEWQRKGVGRFGLQWGLEEANRLGVPVYLEATRDGIALYEKVGFVVVGPLEFDAAPYGFPGEERRLWCMVREARGGMGEGRVNGSVNEG